MSNFRTLALAMKDRIESQIPELEGKCVVFRRSDIESQLTSRMKKVGGKVAVIRLGPAKNESKTRTSAFAGNISVGLFTVPLLTQKEAKDADMLIAEIEAALNYWWPASIPSNRTTFLKSGTITYPEDPQYDLAAISFTTPPIPLRPPTP